MSFASCEMASQAPESPAQLGLAVAGTSERREIVRRAAAEEAGVWVVVPATALLSAFPAASSPL